MRVDFDPEVKAWYVAIADRPVARTAHVSDDVAVDLDADDAVVGVEFLVAPAELDHAVVAELGRRFPAVREALADLRGLAVAG
jgi:uncharacterized protein YuzE